MPRLGRLQLLIALATIGALWLSRATIVAGEPGGPLAPATTPEPQVVRIAVTDRGVDPSALEVKLEQGREVELRFEYSQTIEDPHVFAIDGQDVETAELSPSNREVSLKFVPAQLGTVVIYCTLDCEIHHLLQDVRFQVVAPGAGTGPAIERPTALTVSSPQKTSDGEDVSLSARLRDADGRPIAGASVAFYVSTELFEKPVLLGTGATNSTGEATFVHTPRRDGSVTFFARFEGGGIYKTSEATYALEVRNATPAYHEEPRGLSIGKWAPTGLVIVLVVVWSTYAFVVYQIVAIARSRSEPA
jgi:hypothetical protein